MLWFGLKGSINESTDTVRSLVKDYIPIVVPVLFVFFITRLFLMVFKPVLNLLVRMNVKSHADIKVIYMLFSAVIWVIAFGVMFFIISGDFGSLGIGITVFSAAVVFVLGKPVFNVFAWLVIVFKKPFAIGDRISLDYGDYKVEGDVVDVTLFYTFVRESGAWLKGEEHTGRMITVPNSVLLDTPMFNFTREDPRVWDRILVTITFDSDHKAAKKIMLRAAWKAMKKYKCADVDSFNKLIELKDLHTHILKGPEIEFEIMENGICLELLYLVHSRERGLVASVITERILNDFAKHPKIVFAYPHLALSKGKPAIGGSRKKAKAT
jgi:small-conductance mechanosensitive channel